MVGIHPTPKACSRSEPLSTRALAHAKNPAKTRAFKMVEFIKGGWMPRNKKASSKWSSIFS
jgi:hypothetical protein